MKPLIIHTECSLGWGGQEIRVFRELQGMKGLGYETALIAPEKSNLYRRAKTEGIAVYPVSMASKFDLVSWWRLYFLLKKLKPSVVNTHSSEDSWLAGAVARFTGNSLVIRTRHVSTPIGSMFSYRKFPHLILTTSDGISQTFIDNGIAPKNVVTVPTGIDCSRYGFSNDGRQQLRKKFGIEDHNILVGNICVLRSWKGLDFVLDSVALLPEPFRFMLVGDGPQKEHLQNKANGLGLGDRLCFAGHQENVGDFFSAMDLLFYTSYASEGVPQSLLQGVSSGLPVVAVSLPSIEETLVGIDNCLWVTYGETEVAARVLRDAAKFVTADRLPPPQTWSKKHSLTAMLEKINRLYQQRLGR